MQEPPDARTVEMRTRLQKGIPAGNRCIGADGPPGGVCNFRVPNTDRNRERRAACHEASQSSSKCHVGIGEEEPVVTREGHARFKRLLFAGEPDGGIECGIDEPQPVRGSC